MPNMKNCDVYRTDTGTDSKKSLLLIISIVKATLGPASSNLVVTIGRR
jgi:hypothetical protein